MSAPDLPVIAFAEQDYLFGQGQLRLRLDHVDLDNPTLMDGEPWYKVRGVQIGEHGALGQPRVVLVRGRRLPPTLPGPVPPASSDSAVSAPDGTTHASG